LVDFEALYLGEKASDPTVDNQGGALVEGALYFNTTTDTMRVYTGSAWANVAPTATSIDLTSQVTGVLPIANGGTNLSALGSAGQILAVNAAGNALEYASDGGGSVTSVAGTGTVNGITLTGTVTSSGNLTLGGALSNVNLASQVTGTLPAANGGTGITAAGTSGNVLTSDGTSWASTAPAGGGAWTLITTLNPSAASTIDFEGFTSDYDIYKLIFNLEFSGYDQLACRIKSNGSYKTSSYAYGLATFSTVSTGVMVSSTNNTNRIFITSATSNNTMPLVGEITLCLPNAIEYQMITAKVARDGGTDWFLEETIGAYKGARKVMQGFRIMQDGSATLTGVVQVYGLNK
jgi:hypothetical protein